MAFFIKQGDTLPNLPFTILEPDGVTPVDLTDAVVSMVVRVEGSGPSAIPYFKKPCVLFNQVTSTGQGIYDWDEGDTDSSGTYEYEFEIVFGDGNIQTVPANTYLQLIIVDDIG